MKHLLVKHHKEMAKTYRNAADAMDDDHEHKGLFSQLADHHEKLHKALLEPDSRGTLPAVGEETRRGSSELTSPKAHKVFRNTLIPRAGFPAELMEKAAVDPALEDALDI